MTIRLEQYTYPTVHEVETHAFIALRGDIPSYVAVDDFVAYCGQYRNSVPVLLFEALRGRVRCLR